MLKFLDPITSPDGPGVVIGRSMDGMMLLCSARVYYPTFEQPKHYRPYYLANRWYGPEGVTPTVKQSGIITDA